MFRDMYVVQATTISIDQWRNDNFYIFLNFFQSEMH